MRNQFLHRATHQLVVFQVIKHVVIVVCFLSTSKVGDYKVSINVSESLEYIEYYVTCQPTDPDPVRVFGSLSKTDIDYSQPDLPKIYAEVVKSGVPVLSVTTYAKIETDSTFCTIALSDNGIGLYTCLIIEPVYQ